MKNDDEIRRAVKQLLTARPSGGTAKQVTRYRYNGGRPHLSEALGVSPSQIEQAREHLRQHGVAMEFTPDGRAIVESEKQFQDAARAIGMRDGRDGYDVQNHEGGRCLSGRKSEAAKREAYRALSRMIEESY